jgi:hypothetical protein
LGRTRAFARSDRPQIFLIDVEDTRLDDPGKGEESGTQEKDGM